METLDVEMLEGERPPVAYLQVRPQFVLLHLHFEVLEGGRPLAKRTNS